MELIVFLFLCFLGYALFFSNKKKPKQRSSASVSGSQTTRPAAAALIDADYDDEDDELATFTISFGQDEPESKNKTKGRWVTPGEVVNIAGHQIRNGNFYLGGRLPSSGRFGTEASLVDNSLPVFRDADMLFEDESLGYWPKFNLLSKAARGAYLSWLASVRDHPDMPIGYVFIYFYGLERRIVVDDKQGEVTDAEYQSLYLEISRLRSIYGTSRSFAGYSLRLMELMAFNRPEIVKFQEDVDERYDSLLFRYQLAVCVSEGKPIPAPMALSWLKAFPEYTLRTPARRCFNEFSALFKQQYAEKFGAGMVVKPNKTKLSLHYHPASSSLSELALKQPDLPDPSALKAPVKKLILIADNCTEALSGYSRYLGKKDASSSDIGAMLLLPNELLNADTHPLINAFKGWATCQIQSESKGLVSVAEFWEHTGTPLPARINKKEAELITTLSSKAGFGVAPDARYHHAKPAPDGLLALFAEGHGPYFEPSRAFNETAMALRLGAMVAAIDGNVDDSELQTLHNLINHDTKLSPVESHSLHAYLHWQLNTPANMTGLKARLEKLGNSEKEAVRHILVGVALADGKIDPNEIKQLEKLYTALGFDKAQVTGDVHNLTSSKTKTQPKTSNTPETSTAFNLDAELLALHESETSVVQDLLGTIFVDEDDAEGQSDIKKAAAMQTSADGLDEAHQTLFDHLITKETWDRKDVLAVCDSLKLMVDGALETINDWAYEQVDSPLIDDDEAIYIDLEIANELRTAG